MNYGKVCHICPEDGFDDQIAKYLGNDWTKEDVANVRGIYDSNNKKPLIPEDRYGKLTDDELIDYGQKLSAYRHVVAREHLNEMKDSTRHPASAFARLYSVMDGETKNDRINMVVFEFSEALTRRQKLLEEKGIFKTREEICNGFMADGQKMDGQFSIFEEVFFTFYNKMREAKGRMDRFDKLSDLEKRKARDNGSKYALRGYAKDKHTVEELSKVLNNWGALCSFARMRFRDREGIKLGNNLEFAASTNPDNFSVDGPLEESYVLEESVREAWMTHQGEVSAFSNLGTEVRRFLSNVPVTKSGENGKPKKVKDDLGYPQYYEPVTTHQYLAEKLRGCRTESAMMLVFDHHFRNGKTGDSLLQDVGRALLEAADVPSVPKRDKNGQPIRNKETGKLETIRKIPAGGVFTDSYHPNNHSIITQLLIDMHSNMVPFIAMMRNEKGEIIIKRLNRSTKSESFADYMAQVMVGDVTVNKLESMPVYNDDGTVNWANFLGVTSDILKALPYKEKDKETGKTKSLAQTDFVFASTGVYANGREQDPFWNYVPTYRLERFSFWLRSLGLNLSDTEIKFIWNNQKARKDVLVNLSKAAYFMQDMTGIRNNQDLSDALSKLYKKLDDERKLNKAQEKDPVSEERIEQIKDEVLGAPGSEQRKLVDDIDNERITITGVIDSPLGTAGTQPVAEAIEGICRGIDTSVGVKGIERRVSWYDRKGKAASRYSDMIPSYMGDLIDDIRYYVQRGDGKALRAFLMDKWGQDEFFYDRKKKKFRNMWLQELYDSVNSDGSVSMNSFAAIFGFSEFLGSNIDGNPTTFENFSEKQHAVAMLKTFTQSRDQSAKSQYCDYPCFILGDAGKQRFFRSKHYDEETIMKGLVDAYHQELQRMNNVVALKESLGQKGVAIENMPEGYVKSEHTFSTLMFLNPDFTDPKYFRKVTGLTKDSEIEITEDDGTVNKIKLTDEVLKDPESTSPKLRELCVNKVIEAIKSDSSLLNSVIKDYMEDSLNKFLDRLCNQNVLRKNTDGTYSDISDSGIVNNADKRYNGDIKAFVRDFFWNTKFATIEQIQLFTVDTAFYKDVKDLQKRYKEIYAPGKGLSLQARDYKGRLYTERKGKNGEVYKKEHETAVYFKDIISSSKDHDDFRQTIEKTYGENSPIDEKYKKGSSVTDGQGYRTLESYRAIMGMQGKWTREMEKVYDRIQELRTIAKARDSKSLTAEEVQEIADSMLILQPLKPYMFTLERVNVGYEVGADGKIDKDRPKYVLVPVQHKYAEVILIPELMPKGKLRDIAEWMEKNDIDLVASDACVKVGAFGACDITGKEGDALRQELDKAFPHKLSLSDYRIQSGVPEHLNQDQLFGTQIRKLIYSAIKSDNQYSNYLRDILRKYAKDGDEELEVNIPGAGMQKLTGNNVINLYNCLIMANMFNSFEEMEAHCSSKQQISDMLIQNSIASATSTDDVLIGLSIIEKGKLDAGDFVMPLGDPIMEHDSAAAVLSVFKKGVNKQKIKGGSAVQMAPMGSQEDGNLREVCSKDNDNVLYEEIEVTFNPSYTDTEGNEVPLKFSEYCFADNEGSHNIGDLLPSDQIIDKDSPEWEEYQSYTYKKINGNWEPCVYDPNDPDIKVIKPKIEVEFPGILDMIAYRIPTERLYSAVNCKIKRFSHPMMGGVLKVPVSGTTKAGFDFDIDKLYFFMKDFNQEHLSQDDTDMAWKEIYGLDEKNAPTRKTEYPGLFEALKAAEKRAVAEQEIFSTVAGIFGNSQDMADMETENQKKDESKKRLYRFWNSPYAIVPDTGGKTVREVYGSKSELFRNFLEKNKDRYRKPFDEYDLNKSPFENSRATRNNMIMGLMRQRLKDKETMRERYTPGGFVKLSDAARAMRVLLFGDRKVIADEKGKVDFKEVNRITKEIAKDKTGKKDPEPKYDYSDPSTILIYNQQNQIAAKLIGIFANQNTHHVFCSSLYRLELTQEIAFGSHPEGLKDFLHKGDEQMAAEIDVNMAELLAAAVDAVKDPVLNYLNLNIVTADSAAMLIRLGYSQREIGLLFNQPIIKELCDEIANNGTSVEVAVNKIGKKYGKAAGTKWSEIEYSSDYTDTQTLADNIVRDRSIKEGDSKSDAQFNLGQMHVLKLFNQIQGAASEMNRFVQATRFTAANSIDSTWGGIIAMMDKTEQFAKDYNDQSEEGSKQKLLILTKEPPEGKSIGVINMSEDFRDMSPEDYAAANYNNPLGFEQCMLDMTRKAVKLFGQFYPHFTSLYTKIRNRLSEMTKYGVLDGDTINSITRDTMVALLGTNENSDFDGEAKINDPSMLAYDLAPYFTSKRTGRVLTNREFYTDVFPEMMKEIAYSDEFKDLRESSEFFSRIKYDYNEKTYTKAVYMKGVGGMQSTTTNDIVSAWTDALKNTSYVNIGGEMYRVRDLAKGLFFHNLYRLGFNFHPTSTMHMSPVALMMDLKVGPKNTDTYINFVKKVIEGNLDTDEESMDRFTNFMSMQYILNHLDNYKFLFVAKDTAPVGEYLLKLSNNAQANSITIDLEDIEKEGYENMFILKDRAPEGYIAFRPVICLQISKVKYYYMAQSGSATAFNEISDDKKEITYVKVHPQGIKGQSITYYGEQKFNKENDALQVENISLLENLHRAFFITPGGLQEEINHARGMGMKVHTLREMKIFVEQHPELFAGNVQGGFDALQTMVNSEENSIIAKRLHEATVIWGHPGMGKTYFFKNGGSNEVIDFDTVYKSRINKELNLPEGPEARKQWRREHRAEYKQKLFDLFDEAIADARRTGKKLLVSDMAILRERESDLDVITQMTEENFAQRSEQRNEPYDTNKKLWKQDIDEAMANVSDRSKIVETNAYFSDLYNIEFLKTPSGEVYGFVYQGEIYMDETKLDPQVPIHEYTHIWDEAVMQSNPRLWERGKRLLRDSNNNVLNNLWNEIAESKSYGKKWQAQGKTQEEIDNLIASEVHSRLTGEKGGELLQQIEQAQGGKGIIGKLKRWLKDVFKHIGKTFGTWTEDALNELTLDDFINMPLRDFLDGVNPNNFNNNLRGSSIQPMVIGENGAAAFDAAEEASVRMDNLAIAIDMENSNKTPLTIKQATGWERGADGKWRYEEMDLQINKEWFDRINSMEVAQRRELSFKLGEILDDGKINKLISQYPRIASLTVKVANENILDVLQTTRGSYNPETNTLMLNFSRVFLGDDVTMDDIRSVLMHEIQHLIQTEEGFAEGGNTTVVEDRSEVKRLKQLLDTLKSKEDQLFAEENQDNNELINQVKTMHDPTEEYKRWENEQVHRSSINRERRKHNQKINEKRSKLIQKQALEYEELANVRFSTVDRMFHKNKIKDHQIALQELEKKHERQIQEFDKANPKQPLVREEYFFDGPMYNYNKYSFEERQALRDKVFELQRKWRRNSNKYKKLKQEIEQTENEIDKTKRNLYSRIAGEVESRAVERRIDLTPEERRNSLFTDEMYKDVAQEDLIFMSEGLEGNSAEFYEDSFGQDDVDLGYTENMHSEFDPDEMTYEDDSRAYNPHNMLTEDEWTEFYEDLIEMNPLFASQAKQGAFDRNSLLDMFSDAQVTNQSILERIRRGLDDGSIKPMTIDENQNDIPLCM